MLRKSKIRNRMHGALLGERMPQMPGSGSTKVLHYPTVSSSRIWLDRNHYVYQAEDGTNPISAAGQSIASWRAVGGAWGTDLIYNSTAGQRPTWETDGIKTDGSDDRLLFPSTLTISGNFTLYSVLTKVDDASSTQWAGDGTTANYLGWLGNFAYGFCNSTQSVDVLDTSESWVKSIRRIRRSGSTWYYKRTGAAEASKAGSSADFSLTMLLRSSATLSSNRRFHAFVLVNKLITPGDADDLAIIARLIESESDAIGP